MLDYEETNDFPNMFNLMNFTEITGLMQVDKKCKKMLKIGGRVHLTVVLLSIMAWVLLFFVPPLPVLISVAALNFGMVIFSLFCMPYRNNYKLWAKSLDDEQLLDFISLWQKTSIETANYNELWKRAAPIGQVTTEEYNRRHPEKKMDSGIVSI